jgi:hypothetical protein
MEASISPKKKFVFCGCTITFQLASTGLAIGYRLLKHDSAMWSLLLIRGDATNKNSESADKIVIVIKLSVRPLGTF